MNIIDALVVTLEIDPRQFHGGQAAAIDALRQTERQATQSTGRIAQSGSGIAAFFRSVEHPVASLRHHFETLATSTVQPLIGYPNFQAVNVLVRTLFNTTVSVLDTGKNIMIQSQLRAANGKFTVVGVEHELSSQFPDGPWETVVTATPVK